jgi:uncharacterized membrane protein
VRTDRGLDRFITFLDAIVAIAITLLVLPLAEAVGGPERPAHVSGVFTENGARFWAFLLSFAVIARLWLAHHRMVERVRAYDTAFLLVNLGWALTIVFLPFATQLTAAYSARDRLAIGIYIGTLAVSSLFLSAAAVLVWRRPGLRRQGVSARQAAPWSALVTTGALLVALALGTGVPRINYYALLLLPLTPLIERLLPDGDGPEPVDAEADDG